MNTHRPEQIPPPPKGWIYFKGPANVRLGYTTTELMAYEYQSGRGYAWVLRRLNGRSSIHYAVREGSIYAMSLGFFNKNPIISAQKQIMALILGEYDIVIVTRCWSTKSQIFGKGLIQTIPKAMKKLGIGFNYVESQSRQTAQLVIETEKGPRVWITNPKRMENKSLEDFIWAIRGPNRVIIFPRHLGITQEQLYNIREPGYPVPIML
jgi:hypothetical protein